MMALFWSWDFWYGLAVKWMGARAVQFGWMIAVMWCCLVMGVGGRGQGSGSNWMLWVGDDCLIFSKLFP
jgi:hypothetical protein